MVISGYVKNNVIVLDKPVDLPEGIKVRITIPDNISPKKTSGLCGIWKDNRSAEEVVNEIISSRSRGRNISL